jgi:hypothetical protein
VILTTKNKPVTLLGHVILYPYRWTREQPEVPSPKDRTACAVLEYGGIDNRLIVLLAISDQPNEGSIELSSDEITKAGLSGFRKAFIHIAHYNIDRKTNSYTYNPRQKPKGKLTKALTQRLAAKLLETVRSGRSIKITRE